MHVVPCPARPLADEVRALFPIDVAVAVSDPHAEHTPRFAAEAQAVARATTRRRREFLAGRAAAHRAMAQIGGAVSPVLAGADRAPVWPEGITGSISHSARTCLAVVAETRDTPALGIDIEDEAPLDPALVAEICTLPERAWLSTRPEALRGRLAKLIFSAKECAYKCQFMLSREMLDFGDLEITADLETGQFEATFARDLPGFARGTWLSGRYAFAAGQVITAMAMTQPHNKAAHARPAHARPAPW